MSIEDEAFQHAEAIYNQVSDSNRFWFTTDVFDAHSQLQGEIGAMAAFGVGDESILAIDSVIGEVEDDDTSVVVVIVTANRIVRLHTNAGETPRMDVYPRTAVRRVRVFQVPDLLAHSLSARRGIAKFEATLNDGTVLTFASDQAPRDTQQQRGELLTGLLADLSGR
jgi:hypothetical protein